MASETPKARRHPASRRTTEGATDRRGRRLARLGAAVAALTLGWTPAPSALADAGPAVPSWMEVPAEGHRATVSQLEAELVRRQGGEWVIVSLTPRSTLVEESPPAAPASMGGDPMASVSDYVAVQSALAEYEHAIERRDSARLAQVWMMNPAEQAHFQYLFDESRSISVSIEDSNINLQGDRASLRFAQRFEVSRRGDAPRGFKRRSHRALFASDAAGSWDLESVLEK